MTKLIKLPTETNSITIVSAEPFRPGEPFVIRFTTLDHYLRDQNNPTTTLELAVIPAGTGEQ